MLSASPWLDRPLLTFRDALACVAALAGFGAVALTWRAIESMRHRRQLRTYARGRLERASAADRAAPPILTPREQQVLRRFSGGVPRVERVD